MFKHIKNRILFSYFILLLSCFLSIFVIASLFLRNAYFSYALNDLKDDAGLFNDDFTKEAIINKDLDLLKKILDKAEDNYTIDIFGLKNGVVGNSKGEVFIKKQDFQQEEFKIIPSKGYGYALREENSIRTAYLAIPIVKEGNRIGFIRISTPVLYIEKTINTLRLYILLIFVFAAVISFPVGILLSKGLSSPLLKIAKIAKEVSSGSLTKRVEIKKRTDEIGTLVNTFNEMVKKLEQASRERKILLGNISHELMTPITTIRGFIETLDAGKIKNRQSIEECLEVIKSESIYLRELIEELQLLARLDDLSVKYDFRPLNITAVILEAEKSLCLKAEEKDIDIINDFFTDSVFVRGDYKTLKRVFVNLLYNAIKYSPVGKSVFVSTRRKNGFLEIMVKDEGIGIGSDDKGKIFERFYRGRNEEQREKGIGLGLSIVKEILDAHKVPIRVESQPNKGSTFIITFPIV